MAGLYMVGAWLVTQVAATLLPVFEAPVWAMKMVVAILARLYAALVFSGIFEHPEGLKVPMKSFRTSTRQRRRAHGADQLILSRSRWFFGFDKLCWRKREAATINVVSQKVKPKQWRRKTGREKQRGASLRQMSAKGKRYFYAAFPKSADDESGELKVSGEHRHCSPRQNETCHIGETTFVTPC